MSYPNNINFNVKQYMYLHYKVKHPKNKKIERSYKMNNNLRISLWTIR